MCMEALSPGHKQLDHAVFLMLHATKNGEQALALVVLLRPA